MKKLNGQADLLKDNWPVLDDPEVGKALQDARELCESATRYNALMQIAREKIKGFILGLSAEDRGGGQIRVGDFLVPFKLADVVEQDVSFTRSAATKVTLNLKDEEE